MVRSSTFRRDRRDGARIERVTDRLLRASILAGLAEGLRRRDPSVIVNAAVSLLFAALPGYFEREYRVRFRPWQRLWISAAALVHTAGMLGPYDRIWWWDHVAHTLSGGVVAGATDVVLRQEIETPDRPRFRAAFVAGVTLLFGAVWELLEYAIHSVADRLGFEPLLVHYGRLDAVGDLLFDLLGAGLVIAFGRRTLSNLVEPAEGPKPESRRR